MANAPATLVSSLLNKSVPNLNLSSVSGTVWSGKALGASLNLEGAPLKFGPLTWHLSPLKLLLLKGCAEIKSEKLSGAACRSLTGSHQVDKLKLELPAGLASNYLREANASVDGTPVLQLDTAVFSKTLQLSALKAAPLGPGPRCPPTGWLLP